MSTILFFSKECKELKHSLCHGMWMGLGFEFYCECPCHEKNNDVAEGFGSPKSAALSQQLLAVTKCND